MKAVRSMDRQWGSQVSGFSHGALLFPLQNPLGKQEMRCKTEQFRASQRHPWGCRGLLSGAWLMLNPT